MYSYYHYEMKVAVDCRVILRCYVCVKYGGRLSVRESGHSRYYYFVMRVESRADTKRGRSGHEFGICFVICHGVDLGYRNRVALATVV